jgi:hypothetical protein
MAKKDMNLENARAKKKSLTDFYQTAGKLSSKQVQNLKKELSSSEQINLSNKEIEDTINRINKKQETTIKNHEKVKVIQEAELKILQQKLGLSDSMMKLYKGLESYQEKLTAFQSKSLSKMRDMKKLDLTEMFKNPMKAMDNFSIGILEGAINLGKYALPLFGIEKGVLKLEKSWLGIGDTIKKQQEIGENFIDKIKEPLGAFYKQFLKIKEEGFGKTIGKGFESMKNMGIDSFQNLRKGFGTSFKNMSSHFAGFKKGVIPGFKGLGKSGMSAISKIKVGLGGMKGLLAGGAKAAVGFGVTLTALAAKFAIVAAPIIAIQAAVAGLIKMFDIMFKFNFGGIAGEFGAAMAKIQHIWKVFEINIMKVLEPLEPLFRDVFGGIADFVVYAMELATDLFTGFFEGFVDSFKGLEDSGEGLKKMFGFMKPLLDTLTEAIKPMYALIGQITGILIQVLVPVLSLIGYIAIPIFKGIGIQLKIVSFLIGGTLSLLQKIGMAFYKMGEPFRELGEKIKEYAIDKIQWMIDLVKELISLIPGMDLEEKTKQAEELNKPKKLEMTSEVDYVMKKEVTVMTNDGNGGTGNLYNNNNQRNNSININNNVNDRRTAIEMSNNQNRQITDAFSIMSLRG